MKSELCQDNLTPQDYAAWRGSELGTLTESIEDSLLLELIGEPRGLAVLDIGCGDGTLAVALSQRGAKVTTVDVSEDMIREAKERAENCGADISSCVGLAQQLPFGKEAFDVALAKTILCFVDDAKPVFDEIFRILRPGGRLIIGELGKWSFWAAQRRVRAMLGSQLWRRGHFRSATELKSLAQHSGFSVKRVQGAIYYPRLRLAARLLAGHEEWFRKRTTFGAAFLALLAIKQ